MWMINSSQKHFIESALYGDQEDLYQIDQFRSKVYWCESVTDSCSFE